MINGKTIFSWNVPDVAGGNSSQFTSLLVEGGFQGVCLKVADGNRVFNPGGPWPNWGENVKVDLIDTLRWAGLKVYFWHYVYGIDPQGELGIAINLCDRFHPDGYIWNAEIDFDERFSADSNARLLTKGLRRAHFEISQALCWWALPKKPITYSQQHPIHVAQSFLETVDCAMPMMYWGGRTSELALTYLHNSLDVWRTFTDMPLVPIGRAYTGDGGYLNGDAIIAFSNEVISLAKEENLIGNSWWSFDHVLKDQICWEAIKKTPSFGIITPPIVELTIEEKVDRLVNAHKELFPELVKGEPKSNS